MMQRADEQTIKFATEKCRLRGQAGFSLIEILVSLVILAVGMVPLAKAVDSIMHHQRQSKYETLATMHTTNKIEQLKRLATNEPIGGVYGFVYVVTDYITEQSMTAVDDWTYTKTDTIDNFTQEWSIIAYPHGGSYSFDDAEDIRMIEVTVETSWTGSKGKTHTVDMGSVLHRRQFIE
ncbi:MAG: prepilin-type N-terminal cleavage/methylation domain-containing protein [Candidatus Nitrohelix vancouverensis]|uniref:Prepilin-type N-terminal cleavage/methylation domain-containing protein n=1 Tax=Candidatus Nitrohelix vancouverensis TaxID=2705534 RepID=A0A7T0C0Z7_9BACT|nr:MAG: prepilin-type N-terminal cleavage/methylation domain-containing protein [Candidatus Nitrohelix vancouverensis]